MHVRIFVLYCAIAQSRMQWADQVSINENVNILDLRKAKQVTMKLKNEISRRRPDNSRINETFGNCRILNKKQCFREESITMLQKRVWV